jgi:hypothetical protein
LSTVPTAKKKLKTTIQLEHLLISWKYRFPRNPFCGPAGLHGTGTTSGTDNGNFYLNFIIIF